MKTKQTIQNENTGKSNRTGSKSSATCYAVLKDAIHEDIAINLIDDSPFNRRTVYNRRTLEEMAAGMKSHGILHDVAVRPKNGGRFELMFGHRRLRAARIAGLKTIPAKVAPATDEQAKEIIFSENIHRENPHPMDEAYSIGDMMTDKKNVEDIALRLGKSKAFVYTRIKLLDLIEPFQEIFIHDKISIQDALEIAALSKDSQQDLLEDCFANWKQENFRLFNLSHSLSQYSYDLNKAPFDTKDKTLIPEAGNCLACPFNSATLKSLFPELAHNAICTNKGCYKNKCGTHLQRQIEVVFAELKPDALVFYGNPSETILRVIEQIPGAGDLPKYNGYETGMIEPPEQPDKEEYFYEDEAGDNEPVFAEEDYNDAMTEYLFEMEQFNDELHSMDSKKGLFIGENKVVKVILQDDNATYEKANGQRLTAKAVQNAIKAGEATPELLQGEIGRINDREDRAKELDREKVQLKVHEAFEKQFGELGSNQLTEADHLGARLIIYQSLDFSARSKVTPVLFPENDEDDHKFDLLDSLAKLNDQQFAFLIRMAVAGKSDSKFPKNDIGRCLYKIAESGGVDVESIEKEQEKKVKDRNKKLKERLKELEKKIEKMKPSA